MSELSPDPGAPARVDVLGVGVSAVTPETTIAEISAWIERGESAYVCVTGVHGVMESQRDPELTAIHNRSGLTVPDGVPMVWSGKAAGAGERISRVYGPDLMLSLSRVAAERGWGAYLYGGAEETNARLADRLPELTGAEVVGRFSPPFRALTPEEEDEVVERIDASGAKLVWVGLSTPKQERWMASMIDRLSGPAVLLGVGAAFDIHAGDGKDAPQWVRSIGMHWLYRLLREPRRLWRRYLRNNPAFVFGVLRRRPVLRDGTR